MKKTRYAASSLPHIHRFAEGRAMQSANRNAGWVLDADAVKLLVIIGALLWFALLLVSQTALLDFSVLYTSGGIILEGHRTQLFDVPTQTEFQHRVLGMPGLLPFNHLAYEALLFTPLAWLPFKLALWIWRMLSLLMLLLSTRLLAGIFHCAGTQALGLSLALYPVVLTIVQGQDSILVLLLFAASMAALTRCRDRMAGVLLALALFKPHLVLPIAAFLIWKRGPRFIQGFGGGSVAVFFLSIGVTGLKGWRQMQVLMRYAASGTGNQIGGIAKLRPNLRGMLGLLGFEAHTALLLTVLISGLLFLLVAWHLRNRRSPEILFPPLIAFTLMSSIYVNTHDFAILLIPVLAMLAQAKKSTSICAAACFCLPLFWFSGHSTLFFFVLCAVLWLTMKRPAARQAEGIAAG